MQTLVLQVLFWEGDPAQLAPPYCGEGLLQLRVRNCDPPPQVTVQVPQDPQFENPPSTKTRNHFQLIVFSSLPLI